MSRIGRRPITIPAGVTVETIGNSVTVSGPKGKLNRELHPDIIIAVEKNILTVSRPSDSQLHRSMHGLSRTLVANMVQGVSQGFEKGLEVSGVGYKVEKAGDKINARVGFSHLVEIAPLPGITLAVEGQTKIKVQGVDKEQVGLMAAQIRSIKPPDAYKGKGIRYTGEAIRLKAGKTGKAVGKK
jgi:large subunit ribosomal protein L6